MAQINIKVIEKINNERMEVIDENNSKKILCWKDLIQVKIITTAAGPVYEDLYFILVTHEDGYVLPSEHEHANEKFINTLFDLPNFIHEPFFKAMKSAVNAEFICFEKNVEGSNKSFTPILPDYPQSPIVSVTRIEGVKPMGNLTYFGIVCLGVLFFCCFFYFLKSN